MRLLFIARESWCRRAAMVCSPISAHRDYLCTCSLHLPPRTASDKYAIMLNQAQKVRMAHNKQQALLRLHKKKICVNKAACDTPRLPLCNQGAQFTSLQGVMSVIDVGYAALSNQHFSGLVQHEYGFNPLDSGRIENQMGEANISVEEEREASSSALTIKSQEFDYVVVIDFEATCDKNMEKFKPQEIIEFPSVLVDCRQLTVGDSFQTYVKPVHHPILTDFCTHLTGIQQKQVDKGMPLSEAIVLHDQWLERNGIKDKKFAVLIWSDWDCKVMLDSECKLKGLEKPHYFNRWINLKVLFQGAFNGRKCNLRKAVEVSGLKWTGRAHCGLDDAMNTARLALELMRRGTILTVTGSLESEPLVTKLRRPQWPGQGSEVAQEGSEKSTTADVKNSGGSGNVILTSGVSTVLCYCGVICKRHTVKKAGPTHGKPFLACGRWTPSEGTQCGFFEWAVS